MSPNIKHVYILFTALYDDSAICPKNSMRPSLIPESSEGLLTQLKPVERSLIKRKKSLLAFASLKLATMPDPFSVGSSV